MSAGARRESWAAPASARAPSILVVDDDRRVVELLHIALTAHGFRVVSAADGEEALRLARQERPDLVVLDVRLPKKSGLEVCEQLRQDPDDHLVPIIMVSAAAETDARLQGLARGADDYLSKPFSPKELIARIKRHLVRAGEARDARQRGLDAERELTRARDEVQRGHQELRREKRLRDLTLTASRELHGTLDLDVLAWRLLSLVRAQLEVGMVALLAPASEGTRLVPVAVQGCGLDRIRSLSLDPDRELARLIAGLDRPVWRQDLERIHELRDDLAGVIAGGFTLLAPVRNAEGLQALLLANERLDGRDLIREDLDALAELARIAAAALENARRCHAHCETLLDGWTELADRAAEPGERAGRKEAARWAHAAGRELMLPERTCETVARGARLGRWAASPDGAELLEVAAMRDPSGRLAQLKGMLERASMADFESASTIEQAVLLLRGAHAHARHRAEGLSAEDAYAATLETPEIADDRELVEALRTAIPRCALAPTRTQG